jgi:hypothetical protein
MSVDEFNASSAQEKKVTAKKGKHFCGTRRDRSLDLVKILE